MNSSASRPPEIDGTDASRVMANEWDLVQQAIAGNEVALEILLAPNLGRLYRVAFTMLRNKEDAEDVLQEALCKAYGCLSSFEGRSKFSTWLTRIVINSALMALRHKRSQLECSLDEMMEDHPESLAMRTADKRPDPEQLHAMMELYEIIEKRLHRLPALDRESIRHYAIDGHSVRESCLALGIPIAAFKSRILRTRRKLAHGLKSLSHSRATSSNGKSIDAALC
jgi:RNA polymerase sigma-70 factor (ECF subfamily)